jgi:hypothetical protein
MALCSSEIAAMSIVSLKMQFHGIGEPPYSQSFQRLKSIRRRKSYLGVGYHRRCRFSHFAGSWEAPTAVQGELKFPGKNDVSQDSSKAFMTSYERDIPLSVPLEIETTNV